MIPIWGMSMLQRRNRFFALMELKLRILKGQQPAIRGSGWVGGHNTRRFPRMATHPNHPIFVKIGLLMINLHQLLAPWLLEPPQLKSTETPLKLQGSSAHASMPAFRWRSPVFSSHSRRPCTTSSSTGSTCGYDTMAVAWRSKLRATQKTWYKMWWRWTKMNQSVIKNVGTRHKSLLWFLVLRNWGKNSPRSPTISQSSGQPNGSRSLHDVFCWTPLGKSRPNTWAGFVTSIPATRILGNLQFTSSLVSWLSPHVWHISICNFQWHSRKNVVFPRNIRLKTHHHLS